LRPRAVPRILTVMTLKAHIREESDISRELIRLQIEELWGKARLELVEEIYDPGVVDHMPLPGQPPGLKALAQVVEDFHRAIPDLSIAVHLILAEGPHATDIWTLTGTHKGAVMGIEGKGRVLRFCGMDTIRQRDGRITDIWHVEELFRMRAQMTGEETA
jgi:predicted ester cyclase